jgi:hypothetical protein
MVSPCGKEMTMLRFANCLILAICISFMLSGGILAQQAITVPEGKELSLRGVLKKINGYGPPGFGENKRVDSKITYWILEVNTPITVPCTPERPEWASIDCQATKRLRLFFPLSPEGALLENRAVVARDKRVLLAGILHRQDTAGEITPVYIDVTDIHAVKKSKE